MRISDWSSDVCSSDLIYRWVFFLSFAFSLAADGQSGYFIIIVAVVFSFTVDEQVFFFVNQILTIVFGHFIIGNELNGIGRTGFFAKTAVNAAGEIDSEKFRIAPAVFVDRKSTRLNSSH